MMIPDSKKTFGDVPEDFKRFVINASYQQEEQPMKKKLTVGLVFAIVLMLAAATALAAYTLHRSARADALSRARQALSADYGLTPETLGLFGFGLAQSGDAWMATFTPTGLHPQPLGEYRVTLVPGKQPVTAWTYDDVDPEVWQSGSLDSPIWGQPQLLKVLRDMDAAIDALSRMDPDWLSQGFFAPQQAPPVVESLQEGESVWFGQIIREAEPGPEDMSREDATAIAMAAIVEESSLTMTDMDAAEVLTDFYERENETPLWMFSVQFYLQDSGIFQDWGVVIDARTGEILLINIVTRGNG